MQDTVYKWQKNAGEELRIGLEDYKGYRCVDIRVFTFSLTDPGGGRPTAKGIKIRVEQFKDLLKGVKKLEKALGKTNRTKQGKLIKSRKR